MSADEIEEDEGLAELTDAVKDIVAALNRNGKVQPEITVSAPTVQAPPVNVAVPSPKQAKGFSLNFKRDAEGLISEAQCTFIW